MTNGPGLAGISGSASWPSRQNAAPSMPPMTMPGPKMPPDPPEPIESDVARILANGSSSTTQSGSAEQARPNPDLHPAIAHVQRPRQDDAHARRPAAPPRAGLSQRGRRSRWKKAVTA